MIRVCMGAMLLMTTWAVSASAQSNGFAGGEPGQALPDEFRGKVIYFGNHSGDVTSVRTVRRGPSRDCPRPDQRCPERIGGALEVELEFDGDIVRGKYRGTGGLRESDLIGRRVGSQCRLFDVTDGSVWSGRCDDQSFLGAVKSVPNAAVQINLSFEVVGTRVRDYSEWQRRRYEALKRKRRYQALRAQYESGATSEQRFAAGIELDSLSWMIDRLQPGSIRDVTRTKERRGVYELYGSFAIEGGGTGWARGRVESDTIVCVEFWDMPGVCRPFSIPEPPEDPAPEPEVEPEQTGWLIQPGSQPVDVAFGLASDALTR